MAIQVTDVDGDTNAVERGELIDILRDYGDIENEDYYPNMTDVELVEEFIRCARGGREKEYVRESAEEYGWEWETLTVV